MNQTLPCGCIPGYYLCRTAESIWRDATMAYLSGDWEAYARLRRLYDAHFQEPEKEQAGEQASE